MSSTSYSNFQKSEVWKCRGFLELASAHVLHLPSIVSRVFWTEVMNWVSRRFRNRGSVLEWFRVQVWRWERWQCRVEEFGGMQKRGMHWNSIRVYMWKSWVEQDEYELSSILIFRMWKHTWHWELKYLMKLKSGMCCYGLLQCYPARYSGNLEGLECSETKGFWTVASAHALHLPSIVVQVFKVLTSL